MAGQLATIGEGIALASASLRPRGDCESFVAIHFDIAGQVIGRTAGISQSADRLTLPVRRIVGDAMRLDARKLLMAHRHPAGGSDPSDADIEATRRLAALLCAIDIELVDHVVVAAGHEASSFRALGLL